MKTELKNRLTELKEEYKKGQQRMAALEQETATLGNTMLRISGAIQILEELLDGKEPENATPKVTNGFELAESPDN